MRHGVDRRHPVDGALDLAVVGGVAAPGRGIVAAAHFRDFPRGGILGEARAGDDIAVTEPDHVAGEEAEILGRRIFREVLALDIQDLGEGDLSRPAAGILGLFTASSSST